MITESILKFRIYFDSLPINIREKILTIVLTVTLIGFVILGIYFFRKD